MKKIRFLKTETLSFLFFTIFWSFIPLSVSAENLAANVGLGLDDYRSIQMGCGGASLQIICGYNDTLSNLDDRVCSNNQLSFKTTGGKVFEPSISEYLEPNSTPVALQCIENENNNDTYVIIRYLSGSYNCAKCEQEEVFSPSGERLTQKIYALEKENEIHFSKKSNVVYIESRNRIY